MKQNGLSLLAASSLVSLSVVYLASLHLPRVTTPPATLTDDMLALIRGGFDDGPGQPPVRHCVTSTANCTVSVCNNPGDPCTSCVAGPGSMICADVPTGTPCQSSGVFNCPDAKLGTCTIGGTCFVPGGAPNAQCGVYYSCP